MGIYKGGLRKSGVKVPQVEAAPVLPAREYRKAPEERLEARLGLSAYDVPAPLKGTYTDQKAKETVIVTIPVSQHIGVPAGPTVAAGDEVQCGQIIAKAQEGLSVPVHASVSGTVTAVNNSCITITRKGC